MQANTEKLVIKEKTREEIYALSSEGCKQTMIIPSSIEQLPLYYNHKPSAQFLDYVSLYRSPLYNFGFGLCNTTFTDIQKKYTVEPGEYEIMAGNSSRDEDLTKKTLHVVH